MKMNTIIFLFIIVGFAEFLCADTYSVCDSNQTHRIIELQDENSRLQYDNLRLQMEVTRLSLDTSKLRNQMEVGLRGPNVGDAGIIERLETTKGASLEADFVDAKRAAIPKSCAHVKVSGVYKITTPPYQVYCDATTQGGNWTVIQRRLDGSVDFYRPWIDYKQGFGQLKGEFFIGLENMHLLTTYETQELLILMEDFEQQRKHAQYKLFVVGNENDFYALQDLGAYSGDAGDSLTGHKSKKFSTYDRDNDEYSGNCAQQYRGAWWYTGCHSSNLNGLYLRGAYAKELYAQGVVWHSWHDHYYSLKIVEMMVRPVAK